MALKPSNRIYLDNAATTPVDDRVIDVMTEALRSCFGNPSATHSLGRNAKGVLETSRKKIAGYIGAESKEIIFTSGGTEADNLAIRCAVRDLGVKHIITSPIEHKAVLSTSKEMAASDMAEVHLVDIDDEGHIDYHHLDLLAKEFPGSLISLMHANNEVGTLLNHREVARIAQANQCYFHSDTVQTMGHYPIDVKSFGADFLTCSAHKFNGPKGVGFLYLNSKLKIKGLITGGGQERSLRAGTENVAGIAGLEKALEIAVDEMADEQERITGLKELMKQRLLEHVPGVEFNGDTTPNGALYTVLSCSCPPTDNNGLLLFQLDMAGVCASGGSACNSGAEAGSHVLQWLNRPIDRQAIRFSFGRFTTSEDIELAVKALKTVLFAEEASAH